MFAEQSQPLLNDYDTTTPVLSTLMVLVQLAMDDFKKLLLFENHQQQHTFVVIQRFRPAIQKLCKGFVTTVGLDDHTLQHFML